MGGHYQIKEIIKSLTDWIDAVTSEKGDYNLHELHIDEINTFKDIRRKNWISESLRVFRILIDEFQIEYP